MAKPGFWDDQEAAAKISAAHARAKKRLQLFEGLRRDIGTSATVLVVTHNPAVVAHCDRAITLDHGRVV